MIKIATWNINSIRKRVSLLCDWVKQDEIDIVLLQEIKCINEQFPCAEIEQQIGYKCYINGEKARNGVAVVTKYQVIGELKTNLIKNDSSARYIECLLDCNGVNIRVVSVYVPNGQGVLLPAFEYKLRFFDHLIAHAENLFSRGEIVLICGDYNVAIEDIDTYSPDEMDGKILFTLEERKRMRSLLNIGFIDIFREKNKKEKIFTWWDYRGGSLFKNKGLRIDYILASPQAADLISEVSINKDIRMDECPSDHAPVVCEIDEIR